MVRLWIEREKKEIEADYEGKIRPLIERYGVNPETVVVVKNGEVVTEEDSCGGSDELKLLSVISGG